MNRWSQDTLCVPIQQYRYLCLTSNKVENQWENAGHEVDPNLNVNWTSKIEDTEETIFRPIDAPSYQSKIYRIKKMNIQIACINDDYAKKDDDWILKLQKKLKKQILTAL